MSGFKVVIPARYASERLPGKPLAEIAGRPMVMHVHDRATEAGAEEVLVATDDERVANAVTAAGGEAVMTRHDHASGSDRIAQAAAGRAWADDTVVVNVQGDEPRLPAAVIRQVAELLVDDTLAGIATLCTPIVDAVEFRDPNVVKVVTDGDGYALYFSRAPIPHQRDAGPEIMPVGAMRHIGLYAYRVGTLRELSATPACRIERQERLEQLRALHAGTRIRVAEASEIPPVGVDTEKDLLRVRESFQER